MNFTNLINESEDWITAEGPNDQIVISSRIRLARNLHELPFPGWAKKSERIQILESIKPAVEALPEMEDALSENLQDLSALERHVLVERHLISREHAAKGAGSAVVMNRKQNLSIMINEEDHLRIQTILPGLQLQNTFSSINEVDTALEARLDFAFSSTLGYLTACPTNVGTGMRASVMLHLPGLVLNDQINQIVQSVSKIGLAVRGLYGEGTEAMGNLFQVSNQTTLGETEEEIIQRLDRVISKIIEQEQNSRLVLFENKLTTLLDQIGRAYGVLTFAHSIPSKEALNLLSLLRLGVDLGFLPGDCRKTIDKLFIDTQPAHLQQRSQQKLATDERDTLRSSLIRERLQTFPAPVFKKKISGQILSDAESDGTKPSRSSRRSGSQQTELPEAGPNETTETTGEAESSD